jgi:hypothetical protein
VLEPEAQRLTVAYCIELRSHTQSRHAEVLLSIWLDWANGPDASDYLSMTIILI